MAFSAYLHDLNVTVLRLAMKARAYRMSPHKWGLGPKPALAGAVQGARTLMSGWGSSYQPPERIVLCRI